MVRPSVFAVVASARREVGAPRSGGVVVVVHSATGGVAEVTSNSRTRVELHASLVEMDTAEWITCSSDSVSKSRRTVVLWRRRSAGGQGGSSS